MYFRKTAGMWLILFILIGGCEQQITSPPERFHVTGTLAVHTVDLAGLPIAAPVTFKIFYYTDKTEKQTTCQDSVILYTDEQGWIEFSRTIELTEDEYFSILSDVASESYESINYWTAFYHASDAPAKRMEVQMTVQIKP